MYKIIIAAALLMVSGCTSEQLTADVAAAKSDFHTVSSLALGAVTAALENPETVAEAKLIVQVFIDKAAPQDAAEAQTVLAYINAGNLAAAQAALKDIVARTGPAGPQVMMRKKKAAPPK